MSTCPGSVHEFSSWSRQAGREAAQDEAARLAREQASSLARSALTSREIAAREAVGTPRERRAIQAYNAARKVFDLDPVDEETIERWRRMK